MTIECNVCKQEGDEVKALNKDIHLVELGGIRSISELMEFQEYDKAHGIERETETLCTDCLEKRKREKPIPREDIRRTNVDCEPKWKDLMPLFVDMLIESPNNNKEYVLKELSKIANIVDMVRQAQKKKQKITFDFSNEISNIEISERMIDVRDFLNEVDTLPDKLCEMTPYEKEKVRWA